MKPNYFTIHKNKQGKRIPKQNVNALQEFINNEFKNIKPDCEVYFIEYGFTTPASSITMADLKQRFMLQNHKLTGRYGLKKR